MAEELKKFSIDDIQLFEDDEDVDFALAEIYALSEGNNSHKNPISLEVLKRDAHTMLGKFVVAKYSDWSDDVTTHTDDEQIIGYIPKDGKIQYKDKDGKIFLVFEALISKLYATSVYKLFKEHNFRNVSGEFTVIEGEEDEYGNKPIEKMVWHGITILGLDYNPSCAGSEMSIKRFSTEEADNFYNSHTSNELKNLQKFSDERRKMMTEGKSYKVNKTELKETPWGDIDKIKLRDTVMSAKNKNSLVKDVYLLVEDGWQDAPSEHLKYPVMELLGDTFYYNRYALASALAYGKKENETEVISKVEKLYDKFNLDKGEEDTKTMAEKKFEIEGREAWGDVIAKVQEHEGKDVYVESVEKDHIIFKKDDVRYRVEADVKVGKDDKTLSVDIKWDTVKKDADQKEFTKEEDNKEDGKKAKEPKKKEMSLDVNDYAGAMLEMLKAETEEQRKEALRLGDDEEMNVVMNKLYETTCEMSELKQFKCEKMEEEKKYSIDKIMANVKEDLKDKDFADLYKEGMACKYEEVKQFELKVKAFAYENSKTKETKEKKFSENNDVFMGFAINKNESSEKEDVFKKYL